MKTCFDERKWQEAIKSPDWYLVIYSEYDKLVKEVRNLTDRDYKDCKKQIYGFFELQLKLQTIALADRGPNRDQERSAIKKIIIHHTSQPVGISAERISAIQLINIYARNYYSDQAKRGTAIYSNHFKNDRQVFYVYHWLVRDDGSAERLLEDKQIGWQSGAWDTNKESIAICLDGDFENSSPSKKMIKGIADLIKKNYPTIKEKNILGHREINKRTSCPGNKFLKGWKKEIINLLGG